MNRLANKIAIVTGAGHGIGRAISKIFAEEGASVFMCSRDTEAGEAAAAEFRKAGRDATFIQCDVAEPEQIARVVEAASRKNGRIDVLCNNAAYLTNPWHAAADAADEEWERSFRVSLMGTQWFTKAVLPFMQKQQRGSIVNIGSVQSLVGARESARRRAPRRGAPHKRNAVQKTRRRRGEGAAPPRSQAAARSMAAMSMRFISIIALKTLRARAPSESPMSCIRRAGTICQDRP